MIENDPFVSISIIQEHISSQKHFKILYRKAWKAKQITLVRVYGDWEESYDMLHRWLEWMFKKSPNSIYEIETTEFWYGGAFYTQFQQFKRVFWTFKHVVDTFNLCKPINQIDGTFLYRKCEGTLLIATSQDGNGCVLPINFAIVEKETQSDWLWFLPNIQQHVTQQQDICLIQINIKASNQLL